MMLTHWFRMPQKARIGRKSVGTYLNVEVLEARALLASPVSLPPIISNPITNPVNGLTSSLLNPVTNLLNPVTNLLKPVTNLLNPVTSLVNPILGSIVNPLLGSPLPGSLVTPLVGPVINTLPQTLPTVTVGPVTGLPSPIPLPLLPNLNPGNLFQPKPTPNGSYVPSGISGFGATQYNATPASVAYYSTPGSQPRSSGGLGEVPTVAVWEIDSSSSAAGPAGGNDFVVIAGLGDDEETIMTGADLREVLLAFDDDLSMPNLAATLLTGIRPRASLLPQRDSQVAPVATLLSDDVNDLPGTTLDEQGRLNDLLINPAADYSRGPSLRIPSSEDKIESIPAENSTMLPTKEKGKSAVSDLLMFGFVTAMMAFKAFRARRTDSRKIEQPSLAALPIGK
jgi:hypothetical protein